MTEEKKKPQPCRKHSTISLKIIYQSQYPEIWIISKEIKLYKKMTPQNPGIAEKGTQKSEAPEKRYPK